MANDVIKEPLPSFDLGIENSIVYGNLEMADEFLSGKEVTSSSEKIEKVEKKEPPTKEEPKKEEKPDGEELINTFLTGPEKDEDEEETSKEEEKPEEKKEAKTEDSTFETLSEELYEAGIFTVEEGEEPQKAKNPEEFLELFQKEKTKGVSTVLDNFLSKHGEDRRDLFEAIFVNGVDPQKYLPVYNEIENFEKLDITTEGNQEKVVKAFYTRAGWNKEDVETKIEKLKNYADLEEEATKMHPLLVKQDKQKLADMEEESARVEADKVEADKEYKAAISKVLQEKVKAKDFDGLPLDEKTAAKVFDFLYTKKWKLPSGELLTDYDKTILESKNPENINSRIKSALLWLNNFDMSKVQKKAITKESNQLFNKLIKKDPQKTIKTPDNTNSGW